MTPDTELEPLVPIPAETDSLDAVDDPDNPPAPIPANLVSSEAALVAPGALAPTLVASLDWTMPDRFRDLHGDGYLDTPNTSEYVHNLSPGSCAGNCFSGTAAEFDVRLAASYTAFDPGLARVIRDHPAEVQSRYTWTVRPTASRDVVAQHSSALPTWDLKLAEGFYDVTLAISVQVRGEAASDTITREVQVDDILIVSFGDSYSAGEGNPVRSFGPGRDVLWTDDGVPGASDVEYDHFRSHRTTLSWPALAALEIERSDPRTSVTFVHLAASGARGWSGMLFGYAGVENSENRMIMPSQIEEAALLLGCRQEGSSTYAASLCNRNVDAVTMSIGINDLGFSGIVSELVVLDPLILGGPKVGDAVHDRLLEEVWEKAAARLAELSDTYARIAEAIDAALPVLNTYVMEYPDPTGRLIDGDPYYCDSIVDDVVPGLEMDLKEQIGAIEHVLGPLNTALATAANRHGWTYVRGPADEFGLNGHGYCASGSARWIRTAEESFRMQGPSPYCLISEPCLNARRGTKGTLHPSQPGHVAVARFLLERMILQSPVPAVGGHELDDRFGRARGLSVRAIEGDPPFCEGHDCQLEFQRDVDLYRMVIAGRNQMLAFRVRPYLNQPTDPRLRLFDSTGADITPGGPGSAPAEFSYLFSDPGTYYLGVSQAGNDRYDPMTGGEDRPPAGGTVRGPYQLWAYNLPGQPDGAMRAANTLVLEETTDGYAIESRIDVDLFRLDVAGAGSAQVSVLPAAGREEPVPFNAFYATLPRLLDPPSFTATVFDASGRRLAIGNGQVAFAATPGVYYIGVTIEGASSYDARTGIAGPGATGPTTRLGAYQIGVMLDSSVPTDPPRQIPSRPSPTPASQPGNQPPTAIDGYLMLAPYECSRVCSWLIWIEPSDIDDPEGDEWQIHSFQERGKYGGIEQVACDVDPVHGCFLYSVAATSRPLSDSFTYRVWDPSGSRQPSNEATLQLCVNCD